MHIISNTGFPSLSRNHARQNGVWQSFDGRSYTCKIGNFIYDWNVGAASEKVFLAVQSPTPTFENKSYATGECDYFGVYFGSGEMIDVANPDGTTSKKKDESILELPPTDYPDPCLFNANWQGDDGSMISWISNENNTGVSSSTFVMVSGSFYDLGRPILAAALNEGYILAIHCDAGVAVLCEYSTKDDVVTKRVEKKFNDFCLIDGEEIQRIKDILDSEEMSQQWYDFQAEAMEEIRPDLIALNDAFDAAIRAYYPEGGVIIGLTPEYKRLKEEYAPSYDLIAVRTHDLWIAKETAYTLSHHNRDIDSNSGYTRGTVFRKYKIYKNVLTSSSFRGLYFCSDVRSSFSPDKKRILLHLAGGLTNYDITGMGGLFYSSLGSPLAKNFNTNGFALFDLEIIWLNEEEIKYAIENNIIPIPEKKFNYKLLFKNKKRFNNKPLDVFLGAKPEDIVRNHDGYDFSRAGILYQGVTQYIELDSDDYFIFAEFSKKGIPTWLSASISLQAEKTIRTNYSSTNYSLIGASNYSITIRLDTETSSLDLGSKSKSSQASMSIPISGVNASNSYGQLSSGASIKAPDIKHGGDLIIPIIEINSIDLRCGFSAVSIVEHDILHTHKSGDNRPDKKTFINSEIIVINKENVEELVKLSIKKDIKEHAVGSLFNANETEDNIPIYMSNKYIKAIGNNTSIYFGEPDLYSIIKNTYSNVTHPRSSCAYDYSENKIVYFISGDYDLDGKLTSYYANTFNGEKWIDFEPENKTEFIDNHQIAFYFIDMGG